MALTSNQLIKQVDLPVWEWLRPAIVAPTTGLSCTCTADNSNYNLSSSRYMYFLMNATNFWRYDTWSDTYQQLASPTNAPVTATSMKFASFQGYYNRVITVPGLATTPTTLYTGLPSAQAAIGYKIRIVSGTGAGQERMITNVSNPIPVDTGTATGGVANGSGVPGTLIDTTKSWITSYTAGVANVNSYAGFMCRILYGGAANTVRKILYHNANTLTLSDNNLVQNDPFANISWPGPTANSTVYQIEYNVITVDTAWTTQPDSTSRFVIQSGGIWMLSGATATPFYTLQYYDILHDAWYTKPASTQMVLSAPTELSLERPSESASIWYQGTATNGSTTTITDSTANWKVNQWTNYEVFVYSGAGLNQIARIVSNTATVLTITSVGVPFAAGSQYKITGYDGGTSTGLNAFNTLVDTSRAWSTDRWKNYAVRILSGTGAGQTRTILSNTPTILTLYRGWNVLPDATSTYVIQGDSEQLYINYGGVGEVFIHNASTVDTLSHGRIYDQGIACAGAAWLSNSSHVIYEQMPIAISSLSGTTTITATTVQPHSLQTGQFVSVRGVTSSATDQYNVTGLVQITSVPSTTTFTYTPLAAGSGTYAFGLSALSTTVLTDGSKDYRDNISTSSTTQLVFTRVTPTNINGWYVSGTNVAVGTRVISGAGTTTLTLSSTQTLAPTGVMVFSPWSPVTNFTATGSGGGAGVATITMSTSIPANANGWYISGIGITVTTKVFSGQGTTTLVLTNAMTAAASGTYTLYPAETAGRLVCYNSSAPAATTGAATSQVAYMSATNSGSSVTFVGAAAAAPTAALTRYVVTSTDLLGAGVEGQNITYYSGVLLGTQTTTTAVDQNTFWATATGSAAAAGLTTVTLSAVAPGSINGWYITGTGITPGTYVVSGAGTTTITLSQPTSAVVSGVMTCVAWNPSLIGRRLKFTTSTTIGQDVVITAPVTGSTGTLTFATALAGATGVTAYSIYSIPTHGVGSNTQWIYGNTVSSTAGKYIWLPRGGGVSGIDQLDINTDKIVLNYYIPFTETLSTGTNFAYDGENRLYFTKDTTLRFYYIDVNTHVVQGAGYAPYLPGTAQLGNKMEIFTTADGLRYMIFNRHANVEMYRQLLFY